MYIILDFCAHCGSLCKPLVADCDNCGANVSKREDRLQGTFNESDGNTMQALFGIFDDPDPEA